MESICKYGKLRKWFLHGFCSAHEHKALDPNIAEVHSVKNCGEHMDVCLAQSERTVWNESQYVSNVPARVSIVVHSENTSGKFSYVV